jgi:hypothetical protein
MPGRQLRERQSVRVPGSDGSLCRSDPCARRASVAPRGSYRGLRITVVFLSFPDQRSGVTQPIALIVRAISTAKFLRSRMFATSMIGGRTSVEGVRLCGSKRTILPCIQALICSSTICLRPRASPLSCCSRIHPITTSYFTVVMRGAGAAC